jgi:hypothetical protein
VSDDAFLPVDLLKPAPGVRNATYSLLPSFVSSKTGTCDPVLSRQVFSSDTVIRASRPYPRGPRSGQGCIVPVHQHLLTSSDPLACTPRFPGFRRLYGEPCCAGAPRLPTSGSELSLLILVSMQPSMTTENPPVAYTQFLHRRHSLHLRTTDSAFSSIPPQSATSGTPFSRLTVRFIRYSLLTC